MRIILFDIDGTLLLTGGAGKRASNRAFESLFRIPESWGDLKADGRTDLDIFAELGERQLARPLTNTELSTLSEAYLEALDEELSSGQGFTILPGVKSICEHLAKREGILLGLQTGNLEVAAKQKLRRAGMAELFQFGGFGSDSTSRAEFVSIAVERARKRYGANEIHQVVVIGDTPMDIAAGKSIGARTIAVATGSYSVQDLMAHTPDCAVANLDPGNDMINFVNSLVLGTSTEN